MSDPISFYDSPKFFAGETESYRSTGRIRAEGSSILWEYEISGPDHDDPERPLLIWLTLGQARKMMRAYEQEISN